MSDFTSFDLSYALPAMVNNLKADDFQLDTFHRADEDEPLPDPTEDMTLLVPSLGEEMPELFEEFQVDRQSISELVLPSLDGLFRPFDLTSDRPMAPFADMADLTRPRDFDYEDMDTRDQNVVRTMAQAEAKSREMIQKAQADGFAITEAAHTEAQGLVAEAKARAEAESEAYAESLRREAEAVTSEAEVYAETLRREAEAVTSEAESHRGAIESLQAAAEEERAAAEQERVAAEASRQAAEAELDAVKDRIAGLDQERQVMEAEFENRRRELEAEYQSRAAELAAGRDGVLAEARTAGQKEGYDQGLAKGLGEGRAAGWAEVEGPWLEKTARLADLLGRMENLYQDLWRVNGPLMVQLAIEGAEGILNKELKSAEDLAVRAFEACIDYLGQAHRVVFQARPQDIPLLEEARADQRQRLGALVKVSFQPDERLGPGDLIMESDVGRLDATVKHRAVQVMDVLREAFENARVMEPPVGFEAADPEAATEQEPEGDSAAVQAAPDDKEPEPAVEQDLTGLEPAGGDEFIAAQAAPADEKPEGGDASTAAQAAPAGKKPAAEPSA